MTPQGIEIGCTSHGTAARIRRVLIVGVLAVILVAALSGCMSLLGPYSSKRILWVDLSPDGREVLLEWCIMDKPCTVAIFDPDRDAARSYDNQTQLSWTSPAYSDDGQRIALSVYAKGADVSHIAVMNVDGTDFRVLTESDALRYAPSFSPDGTKLTYLCSWGWTKRYYTPFRGNVRRTKERELCVFDLKQGQERRITDINAYSYTAPNFLPDNRHIVVSWEDVRRDRVDNTTRSIERNVVIDIENGKMTEIDAMAFNPTATHPRMSADATRMVFKGRPARVNSTGHTWDWELYAWRGENVMTGGGTVKRITYFKSYISGFAVSADGRRVAAWSDKTRDGDNVLYLLNTDGTDVTRIGIPPAPSEKIATVTR